MSVTLALNAILWLWLLKSSTSQHAIPLEHLPTANIPAGAGWKTMRYFHGLSHWLNSAIYDFLFISFRDFLCSNVQLPLSHIKLAGLQHPLNHQWVPWLLIYRILWDFGMGFCMPDLLVLEMCILSPITGYLWHNDRETQCTLMLLYQNWEKDFHTSPGCALSWVDTQFTGASFILSCFALGNNSHI